MVWYRVIKKVKNFPVFYDTSQKVYQKYVYFSVLAYVLYPVFDTNKDNSERSRGKPLISSTVSEKLLDCVGHEATPYAK